MNHTTFRTWFLFLAAVFFIGVLSFCRNAKAGAPAVLDTGITVNARMKALASGTEQQYWTETGDIKAVRMAEALPAGYVPSRENTVSAPGSGLPVYIFFDNENDAGIIYFWTEADTITMNPDSGYLFAGNTALTDLSGIAGWDCSVVSSLACAFRNNKSLNDITPLSGWDTESLSVMTMMFADDPALTDLSALAGWNTSRVTNMCGLFSGARGLTDALALRNWDTSNVTDMSTMFSRCTSMMFIDVSNWDTSSVTTMAGMFQVGDNWKGNGNLTEIIGLGKLDVSNVRDMTCMFYGAGQMITYDVARWDVSKVESMNHMFCDNFRLRSLDLSAWDVSSVRTIYCMFDDNVKLKTIGDVSHWNTASLVDAGAWLNGASSLIGDNTGTLDLSGWDTHNLKTAGEMFFNNVKLRAIDLSGWTFDSITNEPWEGAGSGYYYETGNSAETTQGLGLMFSHTPQVMVVYISSEGLESFHAAEARGVNVLEMWEKSKAGGFTVK